MAFYSSEDEVEHRDYSVNNMLRCFYPSFKVDVLGYFTEQRTASDIMDFTGLLLDSVCKYIAKFKAMGVLVDSGMKYSLKATYLRHTRVRKTLSYKAKKIDAVANLRDGIYGAKLHNVKLGEKNIVLNMEPSDVVWDDDFVLLGCADYLDEFKPFCGRIATFANFLKKHGVCGVKVFCGGKKSVKIAKYPKEKVLKREIFVEYYGLN